MWTPDNDVAADWAAALADPLGKLVHLASLNLSSTCHGRMGCVSCVYACRAVSECAWVAVAVRGCVADVEGVGVCGGARHWVGCEDGSSTRCDAPIV